MISLFDANGVSIFIFKNGVSTFIFNVSLLKTIHADARIFHMLQYLIATYSIDHIVEDFNLDLLKVSKNKLLGIFTDHVQMVNK